MGARIGSVTDFDPSSQGPVQKLVIGTEPGPVLEVLDLGATVHRLWVTGGDGVRRNVVLGHATAEEYLASKDYIGGTIGRYANRIAGAHFELDGEAVQLLDNENGNQLHGGPDGFDKRLWQVDLHNDDQLALSLRSPHGDQGFPGELIVLLQIQCTSDTVRLRFEATTDAPTVVGLTSHAYFNLDGDGAGAIEDHSLSVAAQGYLPTDDASLPGDPATVEGTRFDLRQPTILRDAGEVDHCYLLDGSGWRHAATLESAATRTRMELSTDQAGLQVYTGIALDGSGRSSTGTAYEKGAGVALEPQLLPDTPNRPEFGSAVLRPGETYRAAIEWRFGATL